MKGPGTRCYSRSILVAAVLLQIHFLRLHLDVQMSCVYIPAFCSPLPRSWFHSCPSLLVPKLFPTVSLVSPSLFLTFLCCSLLTPQQMASHPLGTNLFHLNLSSWSASRRGQRDIAAQHGTQEHKRVAEKGGKLLFSKTTKHTDGPK